MTTFDPTPGGRPIGAARSARAVLAASVLAMAPIGGCGGPATLAPTPNLYWSTGQNPFDEVPDALRSTTAEILFATDRLPKEQQKDDGMLRYGYGRSHAMAFGTCSVRFGAPAMTWEQLVEASTVRHRKQPVPIAVTGVEELVKLPPSNVTSVVVDGVPALPEAHVEALADAEGRIHEVLREHLARADRKEVYLFVHGYNNDFDAAALRIGQVWHLMGRPGVAMVYSWPAGYPGLLQGYTYDRESSEFTVYHLKEIWRILTACPELERLHVIAHSRGTDVAMSALRETWLAFAAGPPRERKLGEVVLAAPDLDWDVFQQRITAERLVWGLDALVIYLSEEDKALGLSSWLFGGLQRLGRLDKADLSEEQRQALQDTDRYQVIDTRVRAEFFGHAYFVTNPAVLSDLILVLRDGRLAGAEHGRPLGEKTDGFWTLTDSYLTGVTPSPARPGADGRRRTPSVMDPSPN